MRNLKKFLAVILAIAVMATTMVPAFAAEDYTYEYEADALYDLGLISGDASGDLALGRDLTRKEGITIVLKLFGYDPADLTDEEIDEALAGFADAEAVKASWFKGWAAVGVDAGLIAGTVSGNINPDGPFSGKQLATLILKLLAYEPNYNIACAQLAAVNGLTPEMVLLNDVDLTRDQAFGMMFAALKAEDVDGVTIADMLIAMDIITLDQAVAYGLVAIASVEDIEATVKVGEDYTLPEEVAVVYADGTKGTVAVIWEDDVDTSKVAVVTVKGTIAGYDGEVTATITVEADVLEVESVTANNLKEIAVVFNAEVDKDTIVADNFVVNKSIVTTPALQEDGKTVILTVTPLETGSLGNQVEYTVTVENVKNAAGLAIAKTTKTFRAFDATLPEVIGVTFTGPKSFEIEFSEPMKTTPTITVKTGSSSLSVNASMISGEGTNVLTVPLFSTLTDGTTYSITISGATDFAGYVNVMKTVEVAYVKDVTPPTASVVKATQEYVLVEFSKPVSGLHHELFSHTFTAWKAHKLTATDTHGDPAVTSGTKFYVWFNGSGVAATDRPIAQGTTTLNILAKMTGAEIVDLWGNKFAEVTLPISVTADTTAPEVKEIKITAETALTVEFTKNVSFAASNIEVLDKDGKAISGVSLSVAEASGVKKYTVSFGKSLAGKTIIVNIKDVKDTTLMTNAMGPYSVTLDVTDKSAPTIDKVTYDSTDKYLYVFFNEDMDSATALVKDNYQFVNGTTFTKLATDPVFVNGVKTVRFTLNADQQPLVKGGTQILVDNVKDIAGNTITAKLSSAVATHATSVIPTFEKAEAIATDKVVVTYNEELAIVDIAAYLVKNVAPVGMEVALVDGKTQVTLTLNPDTGKVDPFANNVDLVKYVSEAGAGLIKNLFNVSPVATDTKAIVDKIAPAIVDDGIVVSGGKINITFTEDLEASLAGLYAQDLVVVKGTETLVAGVDYATTVVDKVLTIAKVGGGILDDADFKVSSKETITYIQDENGVKATAFKDAEKVTVAVVPTATVTHAEYSPALTDKTKTTIVFSEKVSKIYVGVDATNGIYFTVNSAGSLEARDKAGNVISNTIDIEPVTQFGTDGYARYILASDAVVVKFDNATNTFTAAWSKTPAEVPALFGALTLTATDLAGNVSGDLAQ